MKEKELYDVVVHTLQLSPTDPETYYVGLQLWADGEPNTQDIYLKFHPKQIEELYVFMKMRQFDIEHKDIFNLTDFKK
jgi:hypothetical protein